MQIKYVLFTFMHSEMKLVTSACIKHMRWQDVVISVLTLKGNIGEVVAKVCQSIHISKLTLFPEQMFATYIEHLVIYHFTYPLLNKFLKKTVLEKLRSYNGTSVCWQM